MKRLVLVTLFLSFFGFTSAYAVDFTAPPHNVPFEYGGDTFTWIFQHQTSSSESWVFYCKDTADEPTIDFYFGSWSLYYYWRAGGGYGWYENGYCRLFITYDNGSNWDNFEYGGTLNAGYWQWGTPDLFSGANANLRSNRDIAYNGYPYPDYTNTNFQVSNLNTGDILVSATSFGGFIPSKQLHITRSPELGGGVVVTVPPGFPEFQCGTEGQEECDFEVNLNGQVTLEAQPNAGYAFSHWEINNATMGDTDGTITIPMSEDKDVVAVFKKTFACTGGSFQQTSGTGGWCVDYVNSETGINLSGNASEWWQGAIDAGYATGSDPAISAIVVLDDSSLAYGHVGIVTDFNETTIWIQDSNWSDPYDFQIRNHALSRSRSDISGYIYCTSQN